MLGEDRYRYHNWQVTPNATLGGWRQHSGPWAGGTEPVVMRHSDGRVEVFARSQDLALYHLWQGVQGGAFGLPQAFPGG